MYWPIAIMVAIILSAIGIFFLDDKTLGLTEPHEIQQGGPK